MSGCGCGSAAHQTVDGCGCLSCAVARAQGGGRRGDQARSGARIRSGTAAARRSGAPRTAVTAFASVAREYEDRPIVSFLSPPTFAGGAITRAAALALARDCEGDNLADFGPLVQRYEESANESLDWGHPLQFASGYLYLIVGDCSGFRLLVLSDGKDLLLTDEVETYCGWPVVTQVDGVMTAKEDECDEEGASIKMIMKWRFTASRMRHDTGELQRVLRAAVHIEAWIPNQEFAPEDTMIIDYAHAVGVRGYQGLPGSPGIPGPRDSRTFLALAGAPDGFASASVQGCAAAGGSLSAVLRSRLGEIWSSGVAAAVDASQDYVGPAAADVAHALYLLSGSPVFDSCFEWIEGVCSRCPVECSDEGPPLDPEDEDIPEVIAGP